MYGLSRGESRLPLTIPISSTWPNLANICWLMSDRIQTFSLVRIVRCESPPCRCTLLILRLLLLMLTSCRFHIANKTIETLTAAVNRQPISTLLVNRPFGGGEVKSVPVSTKTVVASIDRTRVTV